MGAPLVEVAGLRKAFGEVVALDGISLEVPAGTVLGLLGPNGAGKTTLVNCLATLLVPDAGTARVAGCDVVRDARAVRERIAVTGQFAAVDEALTGRENLVLFGRLLRLGRRAAGERAAALLERLDLSAAADRPVRTYSGGMRRRLDLAASLVVERPVVFLDEPTTGLDPRSRKALWDVVAELREGGAAIMLTTQYLDEADRLADRIVVVDRGRVIAAGSPGQLKDRVGGAVCHVTLADEAQARLALDALAQAYPDAAASGAGVTVASSDARVVVDVVRRLAAAGLELEDLALRRPTLDDVFLALTGEPAGPGPAGEAAEPAAAGHGPDPAK